jgi:hypothetical protein
MLLLLLVSSGIKGIKARDQVELVCVASDLKGSAVAGAQEVQNVFSVTRDGVLPYAILIAREEEKHVVNTEGNEPKFTEEMDEESDEKKRIKVVINKAVDSKMPDMVNMHMVNKLGTIIHSLKTLPRSFNSLLRPFQKTATGDANVAVRRDVSGEDVVKTEGNEPKFKKRESAKKKKIKSMIKKAVNSKLADMVTKIKEVDDDKKEETSKGKLKMTISDVGGIYIGCDDNEITFPSSVFFLNFNSCITTFTISGRVSSTDSTTNVILHNDTSRQFSRYGATCGPGIADQSSPGVFDGGYGGTDYIAVLMTLVTVSVCCFVRWGQKLSMPRRHCAITVILALLSCVVLVNGAKNRGWLLDSQVGRGNRPLTRSGYGIAVRGRLKA